MKRNSTFRESAKPTTQSAGRSMKSGHLGIKNIIEPYCKITSRTNKKSNPYCSQNQKGDMDMIIPFLTPFKPQINLTAFLTQSSGMGTGSKQQMSKNKNFLPTEHSKTALKKYSSRVEASQKLSPKQNSMTERQTKSFQFFTQTRQHINSIQTNRNNYFQPRLSDQQQKRLESSRSKNVELILKRKKGRTFQQAMIQYCHRMSIPEHSRVFVFKSSDIFIKKALARMGWIQNKDPNSSYYHLKWTAKVEPKRAHKNQILNHFEQSDLITSKEGLVKGLRPCKKLRNSFPRAYDLGNERELFVKNFNQTQILCGLKKIVKFLQCPSTERQDISIKFLKEQFGRIRSNSLFCTTKEKHILHIPYAVQMCAFCESLASRIEGDKMNPSNILDERSLRNLVSFCELDPPYAEYMKSRSSVELKEIDAKSGIRFNEEDINQYSSANSFMYPSDELQNLLISYHNYFRKRLNTYSVEGDRNVWIIKNRNSSKGVGIYLSDSLEQISKKPQNRIAQKYIQNCCMFKQSSKSYKFDLRVWVLVTSFNPVKAYFFRDFYCRICPRQYDQSDLTKLEAHLTNFHLNKQMYEDESFSVLSRASMLTNLSEQYGQSIKDLQIQIEQKLLNLIRDTLGQYQGEIKLKGNQFQLYGFDVLISDTLSLHLLEVNLSPACHQRAEWLTDNLQTMSSSLLQIVLEGMPEEEVERNGWRVVRGS